MSWKRSFYAVSAAELLAIMGFSTSVPIIPFFLQDLGLRDPTGLNFWTGLTQSGSAIALAVFAPIWGGIADGYGRRLMLLRAMFGGALLIGLTAFAVHPWQVLALRTLQGCVTGTVAAATVFVAAMVPRKSIGFCLGVLQTAVYLGSSIGPLFGGFISDLFGRRAAFLGTTVLLLAAGIIVLSLVEKDHVQKVEGKSLLRSAVPDFRPIFADPGLLPLMFVVFSVQLANSVIAPILPLFIQVITPNEQAVATASGLILGAAALSGALAAAAIGKVSDRFGHGKTMVFCLIGSCLLYIPQAFVANWIQLLYLRIIGGFFLGGTIPAVNALIAARAEKERQGAVYGLNTSIAAAGMAIGPAIGAAVASFMGYPAVFLVTAGILGFTGAAVRMRRKAERNRREG